MGRRDPRFPRREGRVEAHAGIVGRAARLHEAREEARRAGRRRSLAPRPAHGAEADQVAGVVQVAGDLAERVGGELGPRRRGSSRVGGQVCHRQWTGVVS